MANCLYCLLYGTLTLSCAYVCKVFKSLFIFKLALLFTFLVLFLLLLLYFSSTFCVVFYFMLCLSFTPFHENQINHFTVCSVILVFDHYQFYSFLFVFSLFFLQCITFPTVPISRVIFFESKIHDLHGKHRG